MYSEGGLMIRCTINCKGTKNKIILKKGCFLRNCSFNIFGSDNTIIIGENARIINTTFHQEDNKNTISVGNNTNICGKTELACIEGTDIEIGNDCLFSSNIFFRTGDSHSVTDLNGKRINPSKNIKIDNHVWIGQSVTITKGVSIPQNCIIGIGSIVTKRFEEENSAIGGNPAKIIKRGVNWDTTRI